MQQMPMALVRSVRLKSISFLFREVRLPSISVLDEKTCGNLSRSQREFTRRRVSFTPGELVFNGGYRPIRSKSMTWFQRYCMHLVSRVTKRLMCALLRKFSHKTDRYSKSVLERAWWIASGNDCMQLGLDYRGRCRGGLP